MGRKQVGLRAEDLRRLVNRLLREHLGHMGRVSLDLVQRLEIVSDRDKIELDCFPSHRTINMSPMLFMKKEECHHVSQITTLGAPPPLILVFHPSKRQHCSCLYLGITRTEAFFMASNASYPDVRGMTFSRFIVLCCFSSTNIMLSQCSHISILC